ncbi:hypothetical protein GGD88_002558 [Roseospira goensis]|uniref:Uncharacterized protein n=1 Tax=Roseospira goensis TaxID=391922 RepID=A0A7W6WLV2_9PROT|nr:hypothetical protein [Roseospira goensis]
MPDPRTRLMDSGRRTLTDAGRRRRDTLAAG